MNVLRLASNVADGETITIGRDVYEIDSAADPGIITAGSIRVNCSAGVTPAIASAAIVAAINAFNQHNLFAVAISNNEILVHTNSGSSPLGLPCSETLAGTNNLWAAANMYGGRSAGFRDSEVASRALIAQEVTLGNAHFIFPFPILGAMIQLRSTTGVAKAWGGAVSISGSRVTLTNNGSTDFIASDTATVHASI